ncbi:MAG: Mg2+ and Co2+ transporter CorB [Oscillospiraceae bacterium]|nr:Mg2+ and Co2+ transporter CorB [Oscillospiraceae bacterium]
MDKSGIPKRKKFKVPRPDSNVSTSHKWTVIVLLLSFILSVFFSFITSAAMQSITIFFAFILLLVIIAVNILFDMVGTAVQSAEEKPFHSLASRKVPGARESISVIRHAPQLANMCCDVIGDIAGIISGATTALIVTELVAMFELKGMLPSLILTGLVGALTIGGKAMSKGISMQNGNSIVFIVGKMMYFFRHLKKH